MWNRKEIKHESSSNLKRNYWTCVAVCFLLMFFAIEYTASDTLIGQMEKLAGKEVKTTETSIDGSSILDDIFGEKKEYFKDETFQNATEGVMATIANDITKTQHAITFIYDAIRKVKEGSTAAAVIISLLGALVTLTVYAFLQAPVIVGERRFFLENRLYHKSRFTRIFEVFSRGRYLNVVKIMLLKYIFQLLWACTIVGGPIKNYEYRAIPYILAENPRISRKECFALAKEMTYGYKMKMFRFDLGFAGWYVLSYITLGLISIFLVNPYYRGAQAEVHVKLREYAKEKGTEHIALLRDENLYTVPAAEGEKEHAVYPSLKEREKRTLTIEWDRHYSIVHLGLIFFSFAMIGWVWEEIYTFIQNGALVNRGSLWGPWLPIYGVGGIAVVILLKKLGHHPLILAGVTFVLCGVVEYCTAWYFETFENIKYWDYSNYLFNIDGRVCFEGLIMFTVLAMLGLYFIAPRFDDLFRKWPNKVKIPLVSILGACFVTDLIYTHFNPHTGENISYDE